jgi:REP element-mobilizing transposase RayT
MARKPRFELAGGLYHVITRGNNRQPIIQNDADSSKFLSLLAAIKAKRPFFLYAYCLMTNCQTEELLATKAAILSNYAGETGES